MTCCGGRIMQLDRREEPACINCGHRVYQDIPTEQELADVRSDGKRGARVRNPSHGRKRL